ncbi:MAG: hypothetical protein ABEJ77_02575 [Halanaeroarchaeum sp.]
MDRHRDGEMHLDVLVEDEFSRFVADGLDPELVVGAYNDRINLGIDSRDGSVDVYLGDLDPECARDLAAALEAAADAIESGATQSQTWSVGETREP